uniref:Uncharacterized protein n=1 Tax=Arundo donax TaxID=35708 RepID=A0A0A8ZA01_ARUDO
MLTVNLFHQSSVLHSSFLMATG